MHKSVMCRQSSFVWRVCAKGFRPVSGPCFTEWGIRTLCHHEGGEVGSARCCYWPHAWALFCTLLQMRAVSAFMCGLLM